MKSLMMLVVCFCGLVEPAGADEIQVMLARHNAFRAQQGLPAHVLDAGLCSYAQNLADRQAAAGRMFHSDWQWPECVCYGAGDGDHAVAMWINSGPHNAILRSNTRAVGFGFRNGFACALFGSPVQKNADSPKQSAEAHTDGCDSGSCTTVSSSQRVRVRVFQPAIRIFSGCRRGRCG